MALVRAFLVFLRCIPECVWAFLLLAMPGPSAGQPCSLAIHNAGILGKLGAETIENLELAAAFSRGSARGAGDRPRGSGAARTTRFSLRFTAETCVRATVLKLLGVVSLGCWIQDARARHWYDRCSSSWPWARIVLLGDLVSALARAYLRKAA